MEIGQVIKMIRKNKSITQQELADAIGMTRPYIARIESGKNSISSDRLTEILDFCNVTYNEFFFMKNDYKISSKMDSFNNILKLYYANNIDEISNIKNEIKEKYEQNGDIFLRHLYILCHCIENKFDIKKIKKEYVSEISDYLLSIDEWSYYELVIFNNFIYVFQPSTALLMIKNILYRADKFKDLNSDKNILSFLLFNLIELSINQEQYDYTKQVLDTTKEYYAKGTDFFEKTLILFYEGIILIIDNLISEGVDKCNKALSVFQALGQDYFHSKYKEDLDKLLNKIVPSNV
ncbi:helix-turn-helix domain-containing protein [Ureibacillus sp. NPDC094379]